MAYPEICRGCALYLCTVDFYCFIVVVTEVCTSCSSLFLVPHFHTVVLLNCQSILKQRDREYSRELQRNISASFVLVLRIICLTSSGCVYTWISSQTQVMFFQVRLARELERLGVDTIYVLAARLA